MSSRSLDIGDLVADETTTPPRIGKLMGREGGRYQLRPLTGGREWDANPEHVRRPTPTEEISAKNTANNEQRGYFPWA